MTLPKFALACLGAFAVLSESIAPAFTASGQLPHFLLMKEASCQFLNDNDYMQTNFRDEMRLQQDSDEGLYTGARARDYALGWPYSTRVEDPMAEGWSLALAVAYIDKWGLFNVAPAAGARAVQLAKLPLAELTDDGALALTYTARYYGQTGRTDLADEIFANLTVNLWPKLARKAISGTVLYAYADYLSKKGDKAAAEAALARAQKYEADVNGTSANVYHADRPSDVTFDFDWRPAYAAYSAIQTGDYAGANTLVSALIEAENKEAVHAQPRLGRLIQLAKAYARKGKLEEARFLLLKVLPFTEEPIFANSRLYVCGELFAVARTDVLRTQYLDLMFKSAEHIDDLLCRISLMPESSGGGHDERMFRYLDSLALAYSYNGELQKAHWIFEYALMRYGISSAMRPIIDAHRAYFSAGDGRASRADGYVERDIGEMTSMSGMFADVLAKIIDTEVKQGASDVAEAFARHIIEVRTKRMQALPAQAQDGEFGTTAAQIQQSREFNLRLELSSVRYKLGEILVDSGRFAEAEETLKLVEKNGAEIVDRQHTNYVMYLGRALAGQKKYTEALELYRKESQNGNFLPSPLAMEILRLVKQKPALSAEQQDIAMNAIRSINGFSNQKGVIGAIGQLIVTCKEQSWPDGHIQLLEEIEAADYVALGREPATGQGQ